MRNVPLAVYNQDRSPEARALLDAYRAADYFSIAYDVDSEDELRDLIDSGKARAGMIIPPDYGSRLQAGEVAQVAFVLDGSDPTVASTALSAAQFIGQQHATRILVERMAAARPNHGGAAPRRGAHPGVVQPRPGERLFHDPGCDRHDPVCPHFHPDRHGDCARAERGTIEQLIVTPIRPWELVVGKLLPYVILAFLNTLEVLAVGSWWFKVPIRSDLWLILALSGLFLLSSLGIGLLASTIANTQQEAMLTVWMTLLPSMFLSGFFFPIEAMPKLLQWISYLMPLRYYLVIIRTLMLKGVGIGRTAQ